MALSPTDPFYLDWLQAMNPQPAVPPAPLSIAPPVAAPIAELPTPELAAPPMEAPVVEPVHTEAQVAAAPEPVGVPLDAGVDPAALQQAAAGPAVDPEPQTNPAAMAAFDPLMPSSWTAAATPLPTPELAEVGADKKWEQDPDARLPSGALPTEEERLAELQKLDPIAYAEAKTKHLRAMELRFANEQLKAAEADRKDFEQNEAIRQEALKRAEIERQNLEAEATALANERPREFTDSVGNVFGAIAGIVLGAYGAPATGGQNMAITSLNAAIERDWAKQQARLAGKRAEINRRQGNVDAMFSRADQEHRAREVHRLAALTMAERELAMQAQNYDPRGTTAFRIEDSRRQVIAQMSEVQRKVYEQKLKHEMEIAKFDLDLRKQAEQERAARKQESLSGWRIAVDKKQGEDRLKLDREKLEQEDRKLAKEDLRKEATEERELSIGGPTRVTGVDEAGKPVVEAGAALMQKDGKTPFKARDKEVAGELTKKLTAAGEVNDIINEVLAIRDRSGGESGIFNSDDRQRLDVLQDRLVILMKAGTQGMSSDEDMKKISGALGAKDIASFRARAAGLEKGLERTNTELNRTFRNNRYTGEPITFPNRFSDAPAKSGHEARQQSFITKPALSNDEAREQAVGLLRSKYPGTLSEEQSKQLIAEAQALAADFKDITPEQTLGIRDLGVIQTGTGEEATRARADLEHIAKNGQTAKIREAAKRALQTGAPAEPSSAGTGYTTNSPVDLSRFQGGE